MDQMDQTEFRWYCDGRAENPHAPAAIDHKLVSAQDAFTSPLHTPAKATSVSTTSSQTGAAPANATALQAETTLAETVFTQTKASIAQAAFSQAKEALAHVGLSLSACDIAALETDRATALAQSGRLEFGAPPIGAIAEELAALPFLLQENALDTLAETQACFYRLRDDIDLSFTDEELAWALAQRFDAVEGDLEALCSTEAANVIALLDGLDQQVDQAEYPDNEYRIVDDAGTEYVFRPQEWDYDEYAPGWDNEKWSDDFDE